MSNRYWQSSVSRTQDLTDMLQSDVLAELLKTDPDMARRLQSVDWRQLANYVIAESIKVLAKKRGRSFVANRQDLQSQEGLPAGDFLGAVTLAGGHKALAWVHTANGVQCVEQAYHYSLALSSGDIQQLRKEFEAAHRSQANLALAKLLSGGQVEVREIGDQIIYLFNLEV